MIAQGLAQSGCLLILTKDHLVKNGMYSCLYITSLANVS